MLLRALCGEILLFQGSKFMFFMLVGLSRFYLGAHRLSDVLGGPSLDGQALALWNRGVCRAG